jgi:hypothetical protein
MIGSNTTIGKYVGTFVNKVERLERERHGYGGYFIYFNQEESLDCYEERQNKQCKLSYCNSYVRAISGVNGQSAQQNARLVVNTVQRTASIKTIKDIKAHEEIFIDYGDDYHNVTLQPIEFGSDTR